MLELTIRLIASLAVVLGLLLLIAKLGSRKFRGSAGSGVQVLHRQPLSRTSAISVITVGGRVLVLGSTEHQINLITELEPEEWDGTMPVREVSNPAVFSLPDPLESSTTVASVESLPTSDPVPGRRRKGQGSVTGPLAGSILSAHTWRQAFAAATRRAS